MIRPTVAPIALLLGCSALGLDGADLSRCPPPGGEFPPTACARIQGRLFGPSGEDMFRYRVRVGSSDPVTGTSFVSDVVTPDDGGRFALVAYQVDPLGPRVPPRDSVPIDLLVYLGERPIREGLPPIHSQPLVARFALLGAPVQTVVVDVRLPGSQ